MSITKVIISLRNLESKRENIGINALNVCALYSVAQTLILTRMIIRVRKMSKSY